MTNVEMIIREETMKRAYMKLFNKKEFVYEDWLQFSEDLSAYLRGEIEDMDFINDYYVSHEDLTNYMKKLGFREKDREWFKKNKDKYVSLYKEFNINEYLRSTKIQVGDRVVTPSVLDIYKAVWYLDDGDIVPCNGNMVVAIRGIVRGQLSNNDPKEERREILKDIVNQEKEKGNKAKKLAIQRFM